MAGRRALRATALILASLGLVASPLLGAAALAAFVGGAPPERRARWRLGLWEAAIVAGLAATALVTRDAGVLLVAAGVLATWAVVTLLSARLRTGDPALLRIGATLGLACHAVAAAGQWVAGAARAEGLAFHPNVLGAVAVLAGASLLDGVVRGRGADRAVALAGLALAAGCVLASASRGALLAAGVAAAVLALRSRGRPPRRRLAGAGVATLVVATAAAGILLLAPRTRADLAGAVDPRGRLDLWTVAIEAAAGAPLLGHGTDAWARTATEVDPSIRPRWQAHPHSGPLQLLLLGGTLLVVLVAAWLAAVLRTAASPAWGPGAIAALTGFLSHNLVDGLALQVPLLALLAVVVLASAPWEADGPRVDADPPAAAPTR